MATTHTHTHTHTHTYIHTHTHTQLEKRLTAVERTRIKRTHEEALQAAKDILAQVRNPSQAKRQAGRQEGVVTMPMPIRQRSCDVV